MASYKRFEDVPAWKAAIQLAAAVFALTSHSAFKYRGDLVNQLRRASLSISNNIAEGYERGTTADLINFLYIAKGSCGESRSMMRFAQTLDGMEAELQEIDTVAEMCSAVSRQLYGWIDSLKNTTIEGDRRLNDQARVEYVRQGATEEFREKFGPAAANQAMQEGRYDEFLRERFEAQVAMAHPERQVGADAEAKCPQCGGEMVKRHDRNGKPFLGCRRYPECRGSRSWPARA